MGMIYDVYSKSNFITFYKIILTSNEKKRLHNELVSDNYTTNNNYSIVKLADGRIAINFTYYGEFYCYADDIDEVLSLISKIEGA